MPFPVVESPAESPPLCIAAKRLVRSVIALGIAVGAMAGSPVPSALAATDSERPSIRETGPLREALRAAFGRPKEQRAEARPFHVGYTVLHTEATTWDGKVEPTAIAVWYPTNDATARHEYALADNRVASNVAVDGAAAPGRFPLVLFSHGATGSGLGALYLTEWLASQGFVVAAPDYPDKFYAARIENPQPRQNFREKRAMLAWLTDLREFELNKGGKAYRQEKLAYRPHLASKAISQLLNEAERPDSPLHKRVDSTRIAAIGHSFGAWTSLLIGGADPSFADSRIDAVVALSGPVNESVYEPDEIASIRVPVMFQYGGEEPKQGRQSDRKLLYDRARAPKVLTEILEADHFTFSGGIRDEFDTVDEYRVKDSRRNVITSYVDAFLKCFLRDEPPSCDRVEGRIAGTGTHAADLGRKAGLRPRP